MPALAVVLVWVGRFLAIHLVVRVLTALGLAWVSYHFAIGPLMDYVRVLFYDIAGLDFGWAVGALNLDKAVTVVLSAYGIRATMKAAHLVTT